MKTKIALIALLVVAAVTMTVYAGVTATNANCCPNSAFCSATAACCK